MLEFHQIPRRELQVLQLLRDHSITSGRQVRRAHREDRTLLLIQIAIKVRIMEKGAIKVDFQL